EGPYGTRLGIEIVVTGRPHGEIRDAITVEITNACHLAAELVQGTKLSREAAFPFTDLLLSDRTAPYCHELDPDCALPAVATHVIAGGPQGDVVDSVPINVTNQGQPRTELVVQQGPRERCDVGL